MTADQLLKAGVERNGQLAVDNFIMDRAALAALGDWAELNQLVWSGLAGKKVTRKEVCEMTDCAFVVAALTKNRELFLYEVWPDALAGAKELQKNLARKDCVIIDRGATTPPTLNPMEF